MFNLSTCELDNNAKERFLVEAACEPTENRLCDQKTMISARRRSKTLPHIVNCTF